MAVLGVLGVVLANGHDAGGAADIILSGTPQYTPPAVRSWVSEDALDRVRKVAPGWDRQWLLARYQEWTKGKPTPANIDAAFLGWAKKFTKGKAPR